MRFLMINIYLLWKRNKQTENIHKRNKYSPSKCLDYLLYRSNSIMCNNNNYSTLEKSLSLTIVLSNFGMCAGSSMSAIQQQPPRSNLMPFQLQIYCFFFEKENFKKKKWKTEFVKYCSMPQFQDAILIIDELLINWKSSFAILWFEIEMLFIIFNDHISLSIH